MTDHYSHIIDRYLAKPDQAHRDAVLGDLNPQQRRIVVNMTDRIDERLASYVSHGRTREERRERLNGIREDWLRERVKALVWERFEKRRKAG